jgi:hypothetical protein
VVVIFIILTGGLLVWALVGPWVLNVLAGAGLGPRRDARREAYGRIPRNEDGTSGTEGEGEQPR